MQHKSRAKSASLDHDDDDEVSGQSIEDESEQFGKDNINWTWVVGIYFSRTQVRFVQVRDRTLSTLLQVIKKFVKAGSFIWTDEFSSYKCLTQHGYAYQSVNHS